MMRRFREPLSVRLHCALLRLRLRFFRWGAWHVGDFDRGYSLGIITPWIGVEIRNRFNVVYTKRIETGFRIYYGMNPRASIDSGAQFHLHSYGSVEYMTREMAIGFEPIVMRRSQ